MQMSSAGRAMLLRRLLFGPCKISEIPDPANSMDMRWLVQMAYADYDRDPITDNAHSIRLDDIGGDAEYAQEFIDAEDERYKPVAQILDEYDLHCLLCAAG